MVEGFTNLCSPLAEYLWKLELGIKWSKFDQIAINDQSAIIIQNEGYIRFCNYW